MSSKLNSKSLSLFALSIFAIILTAYLASAEITLNPTTYSATIAQGSSSSFNFTIFNNDSRTVNISIVPSNLISGFSTLPSSNISVNPSSFNNLGGNNITSFTVTITVPSNQPAGNYNGALVINGNYTDGNITTKNLSLSINVVTSTVIPPEVTSCNATGNPGQLKVKSIDFQNNGLQYATFGKDDEWFPFEEIKAEIELENRGDFDTSNIKVEWGIWDTKKNQWVIDLHKEDEIDLNEGDKDKITVTFKIDDDMDVDLDELADGDHYRFYVIATGEIDDNKAGTLDGADTCVSDFKTASIVIEDDFPILTNFNVPETVQCGENVEITADLWNIGTDDQKDVAVEVFDKDKKLINSIFEMGDIDSFDNTQLSINLRVPKDAEEKTHTLVFMVLDKKKNVYQNDFNDDDSMFTVPLTVSGGCAPEISVLANTLSGGKAGQKLVVRTTITNTGNAQKTFTVNVAGSESWASSFSLDKTSFVLNAGESKDLTISFDVLKNAVGSQTFYLEIVSGTSLIRQPITVSIEKPTGFLGITGSTIGNNWYLWGIGLLNLILILVIIFVAVRIARRR